MTDFLRAIFGVWELRPLVLAIPALFGALYLRGWLYFRRLEHTRPRQRVRGGGRSGGQAEVWRLLCYGGGLALLIFALTSGLDAYATLLLFVHMIQHEILLMFVPALLWLGNPFPFVVWGLPRPLRLRTAAFFARPSPFRTLLAALGAPAASLLTLIVVTWVWHDSKLYNLTLANRLVHDLEHLMFFAAGMLFWWHVVGAAPQLRASLSYLRRGLYIVVAIPPTVALGASIAFAPEPLYSYYTTVPRLWGLSALDDQMYAGVIMWESIMNYIVAILAVVALHLRGEEQKPPLPASIWEQAGSSSTLLAPGLETRTGTEAAANG
jgi:cytochrome c oxidase assembly factor CtaG